MKYGFFMLIIFIVGKIEPIFLYIFSVFSYFFFILAVVGSGILSANISFDKLSSTIKTKL